MKFPTVDEVAKASRLEICRWYRSLPPVESGDDDADSKEVVIGYVVTRFYEMGGMTAETSKKIGWEKPE